MAEVQRRSWFLKSVENIQVKKSFVTRKQLAGISTKKTDVYIEKELCSFMLAVY